MPGIIVTLAGFIVVVMSGFFYAMGLWKKQKDSETATLIKTLQDTVRAVEDRFDIKEREWSEREEALEGKIDLLSGQLDKLQSENESYLKALQGRDIETKEFYRQAFESMKVSKETFIMVSNLVREITGMNENMKRMINLMSEHTKVMDHSIISRQP